MTRLQRKQKHKQVNLAVIIFLLLIIGGAYIVYSNNLNRDSAKDHNSVNKTVKTAKANTKKADTASKKDGQSAPKALTKAQVVAEKVDSLMKQMTLQEKVGQLLMVGFYGTKEDNNIQSLISQQKVGGVILFDRNMENPSQVASLTNQLKSDVSTHEHSIPLVIAADQEGGPVLRMRNQVSPIPSEQELGKNASPEEVYNIAKINGEEMAAMGIQLDLAPVLDLSDQDERSFGSNPEKSFHLDTEEIEGLNSVNVTATLKHFPGNGRVVVDPHLDTSIVNADRNTLESDDMIPFKQMIQQQKQNQFFVMVTHVKYPAFDPNMPASLSKPIIQNLLRRELGYNGIVITDDLDMGAISKYYSYSDLGYMALNAGADILLVCHEYNHQLQLYNGIINAVKDGKLSEERINESVKRILTYKLTYLSNQSVSVSNASHVVRSTDHLNIIANYKKQHGLK